MQALVLVGGEGTRLRPLTVTVPKPALTLVDRPFLAYMIEWLAGHGVDEVVLACGFLPDVLREALAGEEERAGVSISLRGRARAARHRRRDPLRRRRARRRLEDRFLALNGDVLTDLDLTALLRAHAGARARARRSACTRSRTPPPTASSAATRRARCSSSSRRPARAVPGEINAGMYVLERSVLDLIPPGEEVSIERDVFPRLVGDGPARRCASTATGWTSAPPSATCRRAGTSSSGGSRRGCEPTAPGLLVAAERARSPRRRDGRARASCSAPAAGSSAGAEVRDSVLLDGCTVGEGARVSGSILSAGADGRAPAPPLEEPWSPAEMKESRLS